MEINFKDKVVIVTGGAQGIGSVIAKSFLYEDAHVAIWDNDIKKLQETFKELSKDFKNLIICECDISDEKSVKFAMSKTLEAFNKVDVLIANAGIAIPNRFENISSDEWSKVFDINTKGTFICAREASKEMKKQNSGRIIIASSFAAIIPSAEMASYSASKAALISLARVLAAELGQWNITVNSYAPGMIPTNMSDIDNLSKSRKEEMLDTLSIREWGRKEDIASLLLFLASDYARYITGTNIDASGGKFAVQFGALARN